MTRLKGWRPKRRIDGKECRSNEERAELGQAILDAYITAKGEPDALRYDDTTSVLGDLLADLYHYAASEGLHLDNIVATARMHFEQER